ncbi:MAG: RecA-family ATPase [Candidatus Krumholzibacteriia bacterium]|jgi:RecA-family ATPase
MNDDIEAIQVDVRQVLGFIKKFCAGWPESSYVQVEAIPPVMVEGVKPDIARKTVSVANTDELGSWLKERQKYNLYFRPNPLDKSQGSGKGGAALKSDIVAATCAHVDIDPSKPPADASPEAQREHLAAERERLHQQIEGFEPPPSFLVDSGGGFQAFWQLATPATVAEAEAINKALCARFKTPDACWSIQHLMRLPFTTNHPGLKKLEKGRTTVPTRLLVQNGNAYESGDFDFPPVAEKATAELTLDLGDVDQAALAARLAVVQADPDLKLLQAGKPPLWLNDQTRNGFDFALALTLNRLGFSPAEIALCLRNYEHGKKERHTDDKYITGILEKVCAPKTTAGSISTDTPSWQNLTLDHGKTTDDDLHKVDLPWPHAIHPSRPRRTLSIFGGANGLGKSTEVLSQELHIATGRLYWGMPVTKGRSIFISCEDPRPVIKARLQAWLEAIPENERPSVERDIRKNFYFFGADETGGMQLTIKEFAKCEPSREAIELLVALGQGAVSITVETVTMLNGGDEMNTDLMQMALALKEVALRTGASVQAIHHISKEAVGKTPTIYSLRGASSLGDALRGATIMHELSAEQMKRLCITCIDSMPVMGLYNVKASYAPCHAPIYIRRVPGPRFMQVNASEAKGKERARNRLMQFLQKPENSKGVSVRHLKDNCTKFKIEKREVESVLAELELIGSVKKVDSTDLGRAGPRHDIWMPISLL